MKTITFVNQYYDPVKNPPAKRIKAFAEYFAKKGWKVNVVTGHPNYPLGKLQKGYNGIFKFEKINNVRVFRFLEIALPNKGFFRRIINYFSFSFSSVFAKPILWSSDVIFISSPPIFSAIPAFLISKILKKKIIFDVRDLWPESATEVVGISSNSLFYKGVSLFANYMYKNADKVICVSPKMTEDLVSRGYKNIHTITNFAPKRDFDVKEEQKKSDKIKIVYTGIITPAQNLDSFIEVNKNLEIKEKFEWHIVGDGEGLSSLKELKEKYSLDNVFFYGYRSKEFCNKMIASADLCLISLAEKEVFSKVIPSKFFEYLSFGKPVIANWAKAIGYYNKEKKFGLFLDSIKKVDLVQELKDISLKDLKFYSNNSIEIFTSFFTEKNVCKNLYDLINDKNEK